MRADVQTQTDDRYANFVLGHLPRSHSTPPKKRDGPGRATLATAMTHIAIQNALDGKAAQWMER